MNKKLFAIRVYDAGKLLILGTEFHENNMQAIISTYNENESLKFCKEIKIIVEEVNK